MRLLVSCAVGGTLLLLSGLHFYWAAGGSWGKKVMVPQRGTEPLFRPTSGATAAVGVLLAAAAMLIAARLRSWGAEAVNGPLLWANWALGIVFVLRAIGDFRWAGFFKRVRGTPFATLDSWMYSPLCLLLGLGCLYLAMQSGSGLGR